MFPTFDYFFSKLEVKYRNHIVKIEKKIVFMVQQYKIFNYNLYKLLNVNFKLFCQFTGDKFESWIFYF